MWREAVQAAGAQVPVRDFIKPYQMPDLLTDLTVGQVSETGVKVVLAGTNIIGRFSDEITGQDYM